MGHSNRKRINISIQPKDYEELTRIKEEYGFPNLCQLLLAAAHLITDRTKEASQRYCDVPDDEDSYLNDMFDELSYSERTPNGTVPVRHPNVNRYGKD